jgi:hypothetical protein
MVQNLALSWVDQMDSSTVDLMVDSSVANLGTLMAALMVVLWASQKAMNLAA